MKSLGLCFLLVPVILIPGAFAQEQSKNSQISADDAIVQLWNAHSDQTEGARLEGDKLIISSDSDLNTCLYLRVYRVRVRSIPFRMFASPAIRYLPVMIMGRRPIPTSPETASASRTEETEIGF